MAIRGPEWNAARKRGIGGSEAAAALGVSRWKTPLKLYKEKRGEIAEEEIGDQQNVFWGTVLEPVIRRIYSERYNRKVRVPSKLSVHKSRPHAIANVDFFEVTRPSVIGEIKTMNAFAFDAREWGEPESAKCPIEYYVQAQHNMSVTGKALCVIPLLVGGQDFRVYNVPRNDEWIEKIDRGVDRFWDCVVQGVEPEPIDLGDLLLRFPKGAPNLAIEAEPEHVVIHRQLVELSTLRLQIEAKEKAGKFALQSYMQEATTLVFEGTKLASWPNTNDGEGPRRFTLCGRKIYDELPPDVAAAQQEIAQLAQGTPDTPRRRKPSEPPAADEIISTQ